MTDPRRSEELNEVELPAAALLEDMLGYTPLDRAALNGLRDSEAEPVLTERLREAVRRLNPWLDSSGEAKVINAVTRLAGVDLTERNQAAHVAVAFGVVGGGWVSAGLRAGSVLRPEGGLATGDP